MPVEETKRCPECSGPMEEGFLLDHGHGTSYAGSWVEGAPETSFWTGVKTSGKTRYKVRSFRCENCGLLRSYALEVAK
ncbi:MAG TPA: PF20097 family protein [Thermoanaerobaculia bacterium]|nr:PF20097 family protein [Thermoanaerobaculia bacterium]